MTRQLPDYDGSGLVNLVADLELRLTGSAPMPRLSEGFLPDASGYVVVMFDGLGSHQLDSPGATPLAADRVTDIVAGFPTTTVTSLATLVTGLPPAAHGIIGHLLHLPGVAEVVNVLKWVTPAGAPVNHDYASMLPKPNLWERLGAAGIEPITVQPGAFLGSPLSRLLYRGARFESAWSADELVEATVAVASGGRLVLTYFPGVDVAAHVHGQDAEAYHQALKSAGSIWESLSRRLPRHIGLIGTADHGHLDYRPSDKVMIRDRRFDSLRFFGDPRSVYVSGALDRIHELAADTGAEVVDRDELMAWLGTNQPSATLIERLPDRLLLAPRGKVLLPKPFDKRLIGYHGGLEPEEMMVPLLVRA